VGENFFNKAVKNISNPEEMKGALENKIKNIWNW
jgi:hypothetical protein